MRQYHYWDDVADKPIISDTPITSNGVTLRGVVDVPDPVRGSDLAAQQLADLPRLIAKQQRRLTTDDPWQMWRYFNNAQVARLILDRKADYLLVEAFEAMLSENKLENPAFYGGMTTDMFAHFLLGLHQDFMLMGLRLEAERIRRRRGLNFGEST
jgi:hypothetical protein